MNILIIDTLKRKQQYRRLGLAGFMTAAVLVCCHSYLPAADSPRGSEKVLYQNNLENSPVGPVPEELMVLEGNFSVKQEGTNKFLELPGAPLELFGLLFGPTEKEGVTVSARIYGTSQGRRGPTFGVGLGGVGGYKLQVSAAKKQIELIKGETVLQTVPFEWKSATWTGFQLSVQRDNQTWQV